MDRDIKKAIGVFFIGFFTFGIANLVFLYRFSDEILTNADGKIINPMKETVLNIITFGLYGAFWSFKMGQKLDMLEGRENVSISTLICIPLSVLFLRSITMSVIYYRMKLSDVGE
jgi:hypothetical protein